MSSEISLKATVLLVGVGKLGLRYLEGILQTENKIDLYHIARLINWKPLSDPK